MRQFSSWIPLSASTLETTVVKSAAIQVRRAGGELVDYPDGKSAMVCYLYVEDMQSSMRQHFGDELDQPGQTAHGPLEWRYLEGDGARDHILRLLYQFEQNFGAHPVLNQS